ncbi:ubiquitinyl hydrolase 1 [Cryptotrichosporon argae]
MPDKWVPLEASPDVFNDWSAPLGLPPSLTFQDLFSLDPDFLSFVGQPVHAVLLLFPSRGALEKARDEEEKSRSWDGQDVWWIKQTIPNACGSIGLLHALLNLPSTGAYALRPDSPLLQFKAESLPLTGVERAKLLDEATFFSHAHTAAAQAGQSAVPHDLDVDLHFIAFIAGVNGAGEKRVVELDGGRGGPLDRGPCTDLLRDVAKIVQEKYVDRADGDINFNLIVLAGEPAA